MRPDGAFQLENIFQPTKWRQPDSPGQSGLFVTRDGGAMAWGIWRAQLLATVSTNWEYRADVIAADIRAWAGLPAVLDGRRPVGLFIHDSLHTYENERSELRLAAAQLAPRDQSLQRVEREDRIEAEIAAERKDRLSGAHDAHRQAR